MQSLPSRSTHRRWRSTVTRSRCLKASSITAMASRAALGPTRNLHWVFKVSDRTASAKFYQNVLGMTVLRHEEFEEGCEAACNGPYNGRWSKTMIGYGPEDDQFVLELTYNYEVKQYKLGNDYRHIVIRSKRAYTAASKHDGSMPTTCPGTSAAAVLVTAPGGYNFVVVDEDVPQGSTLVTELCLSVADLHKSMAYWAQFLGFEVVQQCDTGSQQGTPEAVLSCGPGQAVLRLVQLPAGQPLERGTSYGRVAFATPGDLLQQLEQDVQAAGYSVHTPYVSLPTPGKATVQVVILQDPDGHEICFVGDEGFRDLSQPDPAAPQLLLKAIQDDKSVEWLAKYAWMRDAQAAAAAGEGDAKEEPAVAA